MTKKMSTEPSAKEHTEAHEKPFLEHLEDLRGTLIKIIGCLALTVIISFFFSPQILRILKLPFTSLMDTKSFDPETMKPFLVSLKPAGAFIVSLKISLLSGIIFSLPFILYFLGQFLLPGLLPRERKYLIGSFFVGTFFFVGGIAFSFFLALPLGLRFLWSFHAHMQILPAWTIDYYISFVLLFLLAFGIVFEIPVVILVFARLGLVTHLQLRSMRKYVIIIILILAAVLTPPDPMTQLLLALPLVVLYEMCIWITKFMK